MSKSWRTFACTTLSRRLHSLCIVDRSWKCWLSLVSWSLIPNSDWRKKFLRYGQRGLAGIKRGSMRRHQRVKRKIGVFSTRNDDLLLECGTSAETRNVTRLVSQRFRGDHGFRVGNTNLFTNPTVLRNFCANKIRFRSLYDCIYDSAYLFTVLVLSLMFLKKLLFFFFYCNILVLLTYILELTVIPRISHTVLYTDMLRFRVSILLLPQVSV